MKRKKVVQTLVCLPFVVVFTWFTGKMFVFNAIRTIAFVSDTGNSIGIPTTDDMVKNVYFLMFFIFGSAVLYRSMNRTIELMTRKNIVPKLLLALVIGSVTWATSEQLTAMIPMDNITAILGKLHDWFGLWVGIDLRPSYKVLQFSFLPGIFSVWVASMMKAVDYVNRTVFEVTQYMSLSRKAVEVPFVEVPDV